MKKFLLCLLLFPTTLLAQTATTFYTVSSIATLKGLTSRPNVVEVVDANPGIYNWSTTPCVAADDVFQITPTSGATGCYTRMAKIISTGGYNSTFVATGAFTYTLPPASGQMLVQDGAYTPGNIPIITATGKIGDSGSTLVQTMAANSIWSNFTSGTAAPSSFVMPSCAGAGQALIYVNGTGITCSSAITAAKVPVSAVGALASAATAGIGAIALVTDANSVTLGTTVAAGGGNKVQIMSNGTAWIITAVVN